VRRGEVWWAELPAPIGRRPVVLLSRNIAYRIRTSIIVAVVTSVVRNIPVEVPLGPEDGMPQRCVVNLDNLLTIPKTRLANRITSLSPQKMSAIATAVIFALDLKV
jgi:mRNA interferase MazF